MATALSTTIFVGGLSPEVTSATLYHAFIPFGDIVEVKLPAPELPSNKDPHRGYGYIEFESVDDAKDAIDNMDRAELFGKVIKVAAAKPQKDHTEGLGSRTAVWEQEGWLAQNAVSEEDREAAENAQPANDGPMDVMQGLEGLDEAGPKAA